MYQSDSGQSPSSTRDLSKAELPELVATLKDNNFFWRRTAQRLIVERGASDSATLSALVELLDNQSVDEIGLNPAAMHAIWTLSGLAESGNADAKQSLRIACTKDSLIPPVRFDMQQYPIVIQNKLNKPLS